MVRALSFFIRYFSNYYTLHRSDLAARAAPLDPRLCIKYSKLLILSKSFDFSNSSFFPCLFCIHSTSIHYMNKPFIFFVCLRIVLCVIFISLLESHVEVFTNQSTETFVQNKTRCFNTRWKPSWKVRKCDFCEWFLNNMTILYNRISVGNKELFQSIIFIILVIIITKIII